MTKEELQAKVEELEERGNNLYESLNETLEQVSELELVVCWLENQLGAKVSFKVGRKDEVLALLKAGRVTVAEIAKKIGISDRNVSSQLSYLRKDGIAIGTDSKGRKFIEG
jgi:biotin operon repressor